MPANRLARICAYSAQTQEWVQFVDRITPVIALAARRVGEVWGDRSATSVDEIVQEVLLKLCESERRILREFEDRGNDSFLKYLRVVTASVATDYFRHLRAEKRGGRSSAVPLEAEVSAGEGSRKSATDAVEWPVLMKQLDGLLVENANRITKRDRSMFWLYYRHGLTAEAISRIPAIGLSAKGVESGLLRMTRLLRETILGSRPVPENSQRSPNSILKTKGFSPVVAIDSMKHR